MGVVEIVVTGDDLRWGAIAGGKCITTFYEGFHAQCSPTTSPVIRLKALHRSFLYLFFESLFFADTFRSRLDLTRIRDSSGHTQTRQHPAHQHDVYPNKRNEPDPLSHKLRLLFVDQ